MGESTWAPTPAPPSIQIMQKLIAGYCLLPNDPEALETALAAINFSLDRINARTWNWLIVYEDILFDSTLIDYRLTSHFKKPVRFMLCDANGETKDRLGFKDWASFLNEHRDSSESGTPSIYSCANVKEFGTVSLDCYPSIEFITQTPTGRIFYYRRAQAATIEGNPDWPSEFTPYVYHYACGVTAAIYAPQKAGMAYGLASSIWNDLVRDDNERQTDWE